MSAPSHAPVSHTAQELGQWIPKGLAKPIPVFIALLLVSLTWISFGNSQSHLKHVPLVNPPKSVLTTTAAIKRDFLHRATDIIRRARILYPGKPFRLLTNLGPLVILPPDFADEIRNSPELDFMASIYQDFHGNIPGFQGISSGASGDGILTSVVRKALTKSLAKVTKPLAEETSQSLLVNLGESKEWQTVNLNDFMLDVVSRVSSRVFLGEEMCRNVDWLRVTKTYTSLCFTEAFKLNVVPPVLRPLVHWFMPSIRDLRALVTEAKALVGAVVEARLRQKAEAAARGEPVPQFDDCLEWAEAEAKGRLYDPAFFQLNVAVAAIHTTTDLASRVLLDLADRPELIADLRTEVTKALRDEGWKKAALYNMKLLDSTIKESQRLKPGGITSMRRLVMKPITLSSGLNLKPGDKLVVDSEMAMRDSAVHTDPETYDPRRFLRWREQPGRENRAQLVSTSPEHLAFGHGEHACPGRFFAANEIKIILCHILLQYDWKLDPGSPTDPLIVGMELLLHPAAQLQFRRRANPGFDIDSV